MNSPKDVLKMMNKSVSFKVRNHQHIYILLFKDYKSLGSTFLRFQEYQESPKFKDKVFSVKEFIKYYSSFNPDGCFTYFDDWAGFNISSDMLVPFYEGNFNPLTKREQKLLSIFDKELKLGQNFYILGIVPSKDKSGDTLLHELAHALFYLNPIYKKEVLKALKPYKLPEVKKHIMGLGYNKSVLYDEAQAYLTHNLKDLIEEYPSCRRYKQLSKKLKLIFKKHLNMRKIKEALEKK